MGDDLREAEHLPQRRPSGRPADPEGLPRQRRGITPQMRGRYPDLDVLEQAENWDDATREVVLRRVNQTPPVRWFSAGEARTLDAFCDTVTAQDQDPKIAILPVIDSNLCEGRHDGYHYAELPDDRDTWRLVARGLDERAQAHGHDTFAAASVDVRLEIAGCFAKGQLTGGVWDEIPADLAWKVVTRAILGVFYAHPWAWNEIGFGGPAYPRGYVRLGVGMHDEWEAPEEFALDPVHDVNKRGLDA